MSVARVPEDVVFRQLDGEGIVLNLSTGMYYGLNPTATVMWTLLNEGKPLDAIASEIAVMFDICEEIAASDLTALVADLAAKGLLAVD